MKAVASRLVCGTGISKTPVRAEIVTGTVRLVHVLAAAEAEIVAIAKADLASISEVVQASRVAARSNWFAQVRDVVLLKKEDEG